MFTRGLAAIILICWIATATPAPIAERDAANGGNLCRQAPPIFNGLLDCAAGDGGYCAVTCRPGYLLRGDARVACSPPDGFNVLDGQWPACEDPSLLEDEQPNLQNRSMLRQEGRRIKLSFEKVATVFTTTDSTPSILVLTRDVGTASQALKTKALVFTTVSSTVVGFYLFFCMTAAKVRRNCFFYHGVRLPFKPGYDQWYVVYVSIGGRLFAGHDEDLYVQLIGTEGRSDLTLLNGEVTTRCYSALPLVAVCECRRLLGDVTAVRVVCDAWHRATSWYLAGIHVRHLAPAGRRGKTWYFPCREWIHNDMRASEMQLQAEPGGDSATIGLANRIVSDYLLLPSLIIFPVRHSPFTKPDRLAVLALQLLAAILIVALTESDGSEQLSAVLRALVAAAVAAGVGLVAETIFRNGRVARDVMPESVDWYKAGKNKNGKFHLTRPPDIYNKDEKARLREYEKFPNLLTDTSALWKWLEYQPQATTGDPSQQRRHTSSFSQAEHSAPSSLALSTISASVSAVRSYLGSGTASSGVPPRRRFERKRTPVQQQQQQWIYDRSMEYDTNREYHNISGSALSLSSSKSSAINSASISRPEAETKSPAPQLRLDGVDPNDTDGLLNAKWRTVSEQQQTPVKHVEFSTDSLTQGEIALTGLIYSDVSGRDNRWRNPGVTNEELIARADSLTPATDSAGAAEIDHQNSSESYESTTAPVPSQRAPKPSSWIEAASLIRRERIFSMWVDDKYATRLAEAFRTLASSSSSSSSALIVSLFREIVRDRHTSRFFVASFALVGDCTEAGRKTLISLFTHVAFHLPEEWKRIVQVFHTRMKVLGENAHRHETMTIHCRGEEGSGIKPPPTPADNIEKARILAWHKKLLKLGIRDKDAASGFRCHTTRVLSDFFLEMSRDDREGGEILFASFALQTFTSGGDAGLETFMRVMEAMLDKEIGVKVFISWQLEAAKSHTECRHWLSHVYVTLGERSPCALQLMHDIAEQMAASGDQRTSSMVTEFESDVILAHKRVFDLQREVKDKTRSSIKETSLNLARTIVGMVETGVTLKEAFSLLTEALHGVKLSDPGETKSDKCLEKAEERKPDAQQQQTSNNCADICLPKQVDSSCSLMTNGQPLFLKSELMPCNLPENSPQLSVDESNKQSKAVSTSDEQNYREKPIGTAKKGCKGQSQSAAARGPAKRPDWSNQLQQLSDVVDRYRGRQQQPDKTATMLEAAHRLLADALQDMASKNDGNAIGNPPSNASEAPQKKEGAQGLKRLEDSNPCTLMSQFQMKNCSKQLQQPATTEFNPGRDSDSAAKALRKTDGSAKSRKVFTATADNKTKTLSASDKQKSQKQTSETAKKTCQRKVDDSIKQIDQSSTSVDPDLPWTHNPSTTQSSNKQPPQEQVQKSYKEQVANRKKSVSIRKDPFFIEDVGVYDKTSRKLQSPPPDPDLNRPGEDTASDSSLPSSSYERKEDPAAPDNVAERRKKKSRNDGEHFFIMPSNLRESPPQQVANQRSLTEDSETSSTASFPYSQVDARIRRIRQVQSGEIDLDNAPPKSPLEKMINAKEDIDEAPRRMPQPQNPPPKIAQLTEQLDVLTGIVQRFRDKREQRLREARENNRGGGKRTLLSRPEVIRQLRIVTESCPAGRLDAEQTELLRELHCRLREKERMLRSKRSQEREEEERSDESNGRKGYTDFLRSDEHTQFYLNFQSRNERSEREGRGRPFRAFEHENDGDSAMCCVYESPEMRRCRRRRSDGFNNVRPSGHPARSSSDEEEVVEKCDYECTSEEDSSSLPLLEELVRLQRRIANSEEGLPVPRSGAVDRFPFPTSSSVENPEDMCRNDVLTPSIGKAVAPSGAKWPFSSGAKTTPARIRQLAPLKIAAMAGGCRQGDTDEWIGRHRSEIGAVQRGVTDTLRFRLLLVDVGRGDVEVAHWTTCKRCAALRDDNEDMPVIAGGDLYRALPADWAAVIRRQSVNGHVMLPTTSSDQSEGATCYACSDEDPPARLHWNIVQAAVECTRVLLMAPFGGTGCLDSCTPQVADTNAHSLRLGRYRQFVDAMRRIGSDLRKYRAGPNEEATVCPDLIEGLKLVLRPDVTARADGFLELLENLIKENMSGEVPDCDGKPTLSTQELKKAKNFIADFNNTSAATVPPSGGKRRDVEGLRTTIEVIMMQVLEAALVQPTLQAALERSERIIELFERLRTIACCTWRQTELFGDKLEAAMRNGDALLRRCLADIDRLHRGTNNDDDDDRTAEDDNKRPPEWERFAARGEYLGWLRSSVRSTLEKQAGSREKGRNGHVSVDDALIGFERLRLHARENMVGVRLAVDELVAMRHRGPSSVTGNDDSHHLAATAAAAASESGDDNCNVFVTEAPQCSLGPSACHLDARKNNRAVALWCSDDEDRESTIYRYVTADDGDDESFVTCSASGEGAGGVPFPTGNRIYQRYGSNEYADASRAYTMEPPPPPQNLYAYNEDLSSFFEEENTAGKEGRTYREHFRQRVRHLPLIVPHESKASSFASTRDQMGPYGRNLVSLLQLSGGFIPVALITIFRILLFLLTVAVFGAILIFPLTESDLWTMTIALPLSFTFILCAAEPVKALFFALLMLLTRRPAIFSISPRYIATCPDLLAKLRWVRRKRPIGGWHGGDDDGSDWEGSGSGGTVGREYDLDGPPTLSARFTDATSGSTRTKLETAADFEEAIYRRYCASRPTKASGCLRHRRRILPALSARFLIDEEQLYDDRTIFADATATSAVASGEKSSSD